MHQKIVPNLIINKFYVNQFLKDVDFNLDPVIQRIMMLLTDFCFCLTA